jgi:uncharacterized membrane protein
MTTRDRRTTSAAAKSVRVGLWVVLGVLIVLAETWVDVSIIVRGWHECGTDEPGQMFGLNLYMPVLLLINTVVVSCMLVLGNVIVRRFPETSLQHTVSAVVSGVVLSVIAHALVLWGALAVAAPATCVPAGWPV